MKIISVISRKIRADGLVGATIFLSGRIFHKARSLILSSILNAPGINLGAGCQIFGRRFISFGASFSAHKSLWLEAVCEYKGVQFFPKIVLGNRVNISQNVHITCINKIKIGNDVLIGSNVYISDHNHGIYNNREFAHSSPKQPPAERELYSAGSVVIEDNVWIGDSVNIVGPLTIGFGSIVASNTVVRQDVPPHVIVAGIPARIIKKFNFQTASWEK